MQILPHAIELLVPEKDRSGNYINIGRIVSELSNRLCSATGAMRTNFEIGRYTNRNELTVLENVMVLKLSFADKHWPTVVALTMRFAILLSKELDQEEVAIMVNGVMVIVPTDTTDKPNYQNETKTNSRIGKSWYARKQPSNAE